MSQINRHRHQDVGFVAGKAKHHTLIARANGVNFSIAIAVLANLKSMVNTLSNIGTLRGDGGLNTASIAVESLATVIETDINNNLSDQLVEIHKRVGCDLAQQQDEAGFDGCLAGNTRHGVSFE